ncbi:MAG: restriction endonuclease [bacterium]
MNENPAAYFKRYRQLIGFTNQENTKKFLSGKDIAPEIDFKYIDNLNKRLVAIISKINHIANESYKTSNLHEFSEKNIFTPYKKIRDSGLLSKLNNQGRRPEQVYFSWMRKYIISNYFLKALSLVFEINIEDIDLIGDDDLINIDTFKRTSKADLEVNLNNGEKIRLEIQSGFQGINDIKQHKVLEAKKIKRGENISSMAIHFDLFNGQVAFVKIDEIDDDSVNWITRIRLL